MSTVASSIPIELRNRTYICDLRIAVYAASRQPAVILMPSDYDPESSEGPVAVASAAVDPAYLTGFPPSAFVAKNYSENSGLWEQLVELRDSENRLMFLPTGRKIMLSPFCSAQVYTLSGDALQAYETLLGDVPHAH